MHPQGDDKAVQYGYLNDQGAPAAAAVRVSAFQERLTRARYGVMCDTGLAGGVPGKDTTHDARYESGRVGS